VTPAAPPDTRPALRGHMRLVATADAEGRTGIAEQSFRAPFHISKPYWDGAVLQVQVVNPTAGMLEGDRLDLDITAANAALLLVTTPAAARAFMMRSGAALCRQSLLVRRGAWLEFLPEPLFPHRDADYAQATRLVVEEGGEAVYWDAFTPGRVGRGERWAWRRLRVSLEVDYAGEPVLRERLDAAGAELAAAAEFHRTPDAFFGTMVILSARLVAGSPILEAIRALHVGGRWVGVSALRRGGWIVRVIAPGGQALRDTFGALRALLASVLPAMGSDLRKL
jgi:urease accessory protein